MFSVIIPAKNEERNIRRCVKSVFNSVCSDAVVEVIVVDNGSVDDTVRVASSEGAVVLVEPHANVSELRNLGAAIASHDILGFIDADCEALPGWLEEAVKVLMLSGVGLTGDFCWVPENHGWIEEALYSNTVRKNREVAYLGSANMVIKKETFVLVGGFEPNILSGEDYVLCLKIKKAGLKVIAEPKVAVVHYGYPQTLRQVFRREIWHGMGMIELYRNNRTTLPLIWSFLNLILINSIIISFFLHQHLFFWVFSCVLILFPAGAALRLCYQTKCYAQLFHLYCIFVVYGSARTISLAKLVLQKTKKSNQKCD